MTNPRHVTRRVPFDLEHTLPCMVAQVVVEAEAGWWRKRAAQFRAARPRPGDFTGRLTPQQVADQDARIEAKARACDYRAELCALSASEEANIWALVDAARDDLARLQQEDRHHEMQATA